MEYDLILKNASTIDENGNVKKNVNIYIKDGKIAKISDTFSSLSKNVLDCSRHFVTPGFVNLHTHSAMNIFKGIAEDVNINDWFNREIFPYESKLKPKDVYWGTMLAIAEMTNVGVTAFADHYFCAGSICDAVLDGGIRADIAPTVFGMAPDFDRQLYDTCQLIKSRNGKNERLKLRMGPHAPYTCPPDKLKIIVDRAKKLGVGIHIHVSETKAQVDESMEKYKKTPFEALNDAGGFDVPVIIGHGLWIQEEDLKYINENTYFAVSPKTYMKLAMGCGNIWKFKDKLNLCTGTDGAASSNLLSPLEQARSFSLIGKLESGDAESFTVKDIWKMLMRGHDALNFNTGRMAEGFNADLLVWNLNRANTAPVYNPLASIIYSADASNIEYSMVAGKFVKKNGNVLLDEENILKNVNRIKDEILERGKGKTDINY